MDQAQSSLIGRVIGGRWRVDSQIGEGGVGAVYRGQHVGIGRPVAIKVLHGLFASQPEFRKRFEREARAASRLSHPACVSVLDFGEFESQLFLIMEFAPGRLLAERLDQGPLSPTEAVLVTRGVAAALRHAHSLGIVHRDLKPANVMLLDDSVTGVPCKLLDFGLAKNVGPEPSEQLTQLGTVFGTPGYISPEQAQGFPADARSDLYSLGVVLWEMLIGRKPFVHDDPIETLRDHISTPAPRVRTRLPKISPELEAVVARLLEKDPRVRFQSAEQLMTALARVPEAFASGRTEARAAGAPAPTAQPRPVQRVTLGSPPVAPAVSPPLRRWQVVLGAAGAVTLFGVAALIWRPAPSAPVGEPRPAAPAPEAREGKLEMRPLPAPTRMRPPSAPAGGAAASHVYKAHQFSERLWCSDAFLEYERAIAIDSSVRDDPKVTEDAVHCMIESQHGRGLAIRFLSQVVGPSAEERLRELASGARAPEVRRAAELALDRMNR